MSERRGAVLAVLFACANAPPHKAAEPLPPPLEKATVCGPHAERLMAIYPDPATPPAAAAATGSTSDVRVTTADLSGDCSAPEIKTIYGDDDRYPVECVLDERVRSQALAVAEMLDKDELTDAPNDFQAIKSPQSFASRYKLCPGERFGSDLSFGYCTAFLVRPDVIATAAHCFKDEDVNEVRFVFSHARSNVVLMNEHLIASHDVFSVVGEPLIDSVHDVAVARLDHAPSDRSPVTIAPSALTDEANVYVLGHPRGLPTTVVLSTPVKVVADPTFTADLDTFGGNSGSPVFDVSSGEVAGVLVEGDRDFVRKRKCYVVKRCAPGECTGEIAQFANSVTALLPRLDVQQSAPSSQP